MEKKNYVSKMFKRLTAIKIYEQIYLKISKWFSSCALWQQFFYLMECNFCSWKLNINELYTYHRFLNCDNCNYCFRTYFFPKKCVSFVATYKYKIIVIYFKTIIQIIISAVTRTFLYFAFFYESNMFIRCMNQLASKARHTLIL